MRNTGLAADARTDETDDVIRAGEIPTETVLKIQAAREDARLNGFT